MTGGGVYHELLGAGSVAVGCAEFQTRRASQVCEKTGPARSKRALQGKDSRREKGKEKIMIRWRDVVPRMMAE